MLRQTENLLEVIDSKCVPLYRLIKRVLQLPERLLKRLMVLD